MKDMTQMPSIREQIKVRFNTKGQAIKTNGSKYKTKLESINWYWEVEASFEGHQRKHLVGYLNMYYLFLIYAEDIYIYICICITIFLE